jgi:hypothetical protein
MSKGTFSATAADSIVIAADEYRGEINLQHASGNAVYLGFGEAAVVGQGIFLSSAAAFLQINDHRARMAIHMKCDTGHTATGGYQTA